MKKEYIEPRAKAVKLKFAQTLLAGSTVTLTKVTSNLDEDGQIEIGETPIVVGEDGVWGR